MTSDSYDIVCIFRSDIFEPFEGRTRVSLEVAADVWEVDPEDVAAVSGLTMFCADLDKRIVDSSTFLKIILC